MVSTIFRKEKKTVGKKNGEYAFEEKKKTRLIRRKRVSTHLEEKKLMKMKEGEYTFRRKKIDENERG